MWMSGTNSDPHDFGLSFLRKFSQTGNRQKESFKLNCAKLFAQAKIDILGDIGKESEGEMHLISIHPAHPADMRVKIDKGVLDGIGHVDGGEESLEIHRRFEPARASSPVGPTEEGRRLFTIFITCAVKFGKSALAIINARA